MEVIFSSKLFVPIVMTSMAMVLEDSALVFYCNALVFYCKDYLSDGEEESLL